MTTQTPRTFRMAATALAVAGASAGIALAGATPAGATPAGAINRLNRRELAAQEAPPRVGTILARCRALAPETDGYVDMRVAIGPHDRRDDAVLALAAIDPSGLVKGWAVDHAGEILEAAGARSYSINAGGDILLRGGATPGAGWRIGIQHPLQRDKVAAVLTVTDLAVATSGAYEWTWAGVTSP